MDNDRPIASSLRREEILAAIAAVEERFPFPGYIGLGSREGMVRTIQQLSQFWTVPGRLLDIGCGPMDNTAVFAQLGFTCYSADDLQDEWHRRGNNLETILAFGRSSGIEFHLQEDNWNIPFQLESFDLLTLFEVIEHLHESPRALLNMAGRFLRDGGLLCVTVPNSVNLRKRISVVTGKTNYPPIEHFFNAPERWRGHVREYTLNELKYVCLAMGFEVLSLFAFERIAYDRFAGLPLQAFRICARLIPTFQSHLCVVARKPAGWQPRESNPDAYRDAVASVLPSVIR